MGRPSKLIDNKSFRVESLSTRPGRLTMGSPQPTLERPLPNINFDNTADGAGVQMSLDGKPVGNVMGAADITALIDALGMIRASMAPEIPTTLPDPVPVRVATHWWICRMNPGPGVLLALRHPGLGWTALALQRPHAEAMQIEMEKQLRAGGEPAAKPS